MKREFIESLITKKKPILIFAKDNDHAVDFLKKNFVILTILFLAM